MMNVVVYGYSTEGYALASQLVKQGIDVHLADETTASAVLLRPEIARTYPDVATLMNDEPLLQAKPIKSATADADYLFFAPRIRKTGIDAKAEMSQKFKDAVTYLSEEGSVVYCAPSGLGGNFEYMALLKHITGIDATETTSYYYYPLVVDRLPNVIGSVDSKENDELAKMLGGKKFVDIETSERMHAVRTLTKFARVISIIEMYKDSDPTLLPPDDEIYLDSMIDGLFDLQLISDSYRGDRAVQYLISGSIRGINSYVRRLADSVRTTIRKNNMKISRTDIVLAWSLDRYGMRSDKINTFDTLKNRLGSYTGTILDYSSIRGFYSTKTILAVVCSRADYNDMRQDPDSTEIHMIKSVPAIPE